MASAPETLISPRSSSRSASKKILWLLLGMAALFVVITTDALIAVDYPMFHDYRVVLIQDRLLLVPHILLSMTALTLGPALFSSRVRQRYTKLHRVLGRVYVTCVLLGMPAAMALAYGRPLFPATMMQGGAWMLCAFMAFYAATRRRIAAHRRWMVRGYAVGFTFVTLRLLDLWPAYWNMSDMTNRTVILCVTFASFVVADIGLDWREIVSR